MNRLNSNIVTIQYDAKGNVTSKSNVGATLTIDRRS